MKSNYDQKSGHSVKNNETFKSLIFMKTKTMFPYTSVVD